MAKFLLSVLFCTLLRAPPCLGVIPRDVFILGGQSNMAGRGGVQKYDGENFEWSPYVPVESYPSPGIVRLNANLTWVEAVEPIHKDIDWKKTNGVGPGLAFANELYAKGGHKIGVVGLVPCAIGGTYIKDWLKGTEKYAMLLNRTRASQPGGTIRAFFWFQGESDASVKQEADAYEDNFVKFITDLRTDLCLPNLPVFLIETSAYDTYYKGYVDNLAKVREAQERAAKRLPNTILIDSLELVENRTDGFNRDHVHFSTRSQVALGKWMARKFLSHFGNSL